MIKYLFVILVACLGAASCISCKSVYYKTDGKTTVITTDTTYTEHGASYYKPDSSVLPDDKD